jgi:hypothetical protein
MARIPVVGPGQVHTTQLSPKLRQILHERAARQNRREYAPVIAADKSAIAVPQAEYETQTGAAKGATSAIEGSLAAALAGLKESGLSGHSLQQAIAGLSSRQGEALQSLPYAYAGAAEERTKAQREARLGLQQDRAKMLSGIASDFDNLLESSRSSGAQSLKEKEGRERSHDQEAAQNEREHEADVKENHREHAQDVYGQGGSAEVTDNTQSLYDVALSGYKYLLAHHGEATKSGNELKPPKTAAEWEEFVHVVKKEAGAGSYHDALTAVEMLRKQLARLQHQGNLPASGSEAKGG